MAYGRLTDNGIEYYKPKNGGIETNNYLIINPSAEQLIECGWYPVRIIFGNGNDYVHADVLYHFINDVEEARTRKLNEINEYDTSYNVNCFYLNDMELWIPRETRVSLQNSTSILLKNGIETTTLWEGTFHVELPCTLLLQLLDALEIYALGCFNKTAEHKANAMMMNSVEDINSYDHTSGYPEKLTFNL